MSLLRRPAVVIYPRRVSGSVGSSGLSGLKAQALSWRGWVRLIILSALLGLAGSGSAHALSSEDCLHNLSWVLGFDARRAAALSEETELTYGLTERILAVTFAVGPWNQGSCTQVAEETSSALYEYMQKRLELLLARGDLPRFYHEYRILQPLHSAGRAVERLQRVLPADFENRYLNQLREGLSRELLASPWARYAGTEFFLTEWTEEWRQALGADSVAATEMVRARVAIDPFALPPAELEYYLFHEIAHLVHWAEYPEERKGLVRNEVAAWQETIRWIDWRTARGDSVPDSTLRLRESVQVFGVRAWAAAALRSRH